MHCSRRVRETLVGPGGRRVGVRSHGSPPDSVLSGAKSPEIALLRPFRGSRLRCVLWSSVITVNFHNLRLITRLEPRVWCRRRWGEDSLVSRVNVGL